MDEFKYTKEEKEINKVLKYNQKLSQEMLTDSNTEIIRDQTDKSIASSEKLLKSLRYDERISLAQDKAKKVRETSELEHKPEIKDWNILLWKANESFPDEITIEDILTSDEITRVYNELDEINEEFSAKTSIVNKTDLRFLTIATALQVTKVLIFPYIAEKFGYGESFSPDTRKVHNDKTIEREHRQKNDEFRDKHIEKHGKGYWINILYQTPPYDITKGSGNLGINMEGKYHRLHTLGHDPILGWLFGTANILTDVITLNNFTSYRVQREPHMQILPERVGIVTLFEESYQMIKKDYLNLPVAIFAEAQHLKSDVNTKTGLPVPLLASFNEGFASKLYKKQYDALCFARDTKIVGASYAVSLMMDMVIGLAHGLFREKEENTKLYEVRTRKILLISNVIASTSSIIQASITSNPKKLDIGSLLATVTHLFADIRFMAKIKEEFVHAEIDKRVQAELGEIEKMFDTF